MEKVKKYYNEFNYPNLKFYKKKQIRNNKKLLLKILSFGNLKLEDIKSKKILDAGCGTGEKSIFFSEHKAKVTAIDFADGQLKVAIKNSKSKNLKINFKKKDIISDNLLDLGKFDIIICLGVLHHTENAYKAFCNLIPLLKKDGIIIIGLYHKYSRFLYRLERFLLRIFISKDPKKIMYFILKSPVCKNLRKASTTTLYDRYAVPYESYHTLKEVKKWFRNNNIQLLNNSDNVNGIELLKLLERKTIFFVGGEKK